jgi:hypothetical protein
VIPRSAALVFVAVLVGLAPAAAAQSDSQPPAQSRQEELRRLRARKATELAPYQPPKIEQGLIFLEEGGYIDRLLNPPSGFFPFIGGITPGAGASAGPGYRNRGLFNGRAAFIAIAAGSWRRYWTLDAQLIVPALAGGWLFADARVSRSSYPEEDFFGLGPDTVREDKTTYDLRNNRFGGSAGVRLARWAVIGQRVEYSTPRLRGGAAGDVPSTGEQYDDADAPGLDAQPDFLTYETFLSVDYRAPGPNARRGGYYTVAFARFNDQDLDRYTFDRWTVDLQQYLSILKGHRVLALRAAATLTEASGGQQVPFYLMPWLGGSHMVRAYPSLRFRDRNMLLLQAEYRWEVLPFLGGALFFDAGSVESDRDDFVLRRLKTDYGLGIRWGTPRGVFLRTDFAIGGDSGFRFLLRTSNAF